MEEEKLELTNEEVMKCELAWKNISESGLDSYRSHELKYALNQMGYQIGQFELLKKTSEFDAKNGGIIRFQDFLQILDDHKKSVKIQNRQDTMDAFISLGGNEDGSGHIQASKLKTVMKDEFQLTIDVDQLIADIDEDGSGEIEFDEFEALLNFKENK